MYLILQFERDFPQIHLPKPKFIRFVNFVFCFAFLFSFWWKSRPETISQPYKKYNNFSLILTSLLNGNNSGPCVGVLDQYCSPDVVGNEYIESHRPGR